MYFQKILFHSNLVATVQLHTTWILILDLLKYVHVKVFKSKYGIYLFLPYLGNSIIYFY